MDKTFNVTVEWEPDTSYGDDCPYSETLIDEGGNTLYSVCNLYECPEDAIIVRDLVSAYDIIRFIELGMRLHAEGYTSIKVDSVEKEA